MSDVWETAKQMELESKTLYEKLYADTANKEIAGVFGRLAREEEKHYQLFSSLQQKMPVEASQESNIVADVKAVFQELTGHFDEKEVIEDAESVYGKALGLEEKSASFYGDLLEKVDDPKEKEAVELIVTEEKRHAEILRGFLEFVRRPKRWLEDREFNHLEEY